MEKSPCPKCGADNFETDAQCLSCGAHLGRAAMAEDAAKSKPGPQPVTPGPKTETTRPLSGDELKARIRRRKSVVRVAIAVPVGLAVLFVLSFHFVTSEGHGLRVIRKQYPTWRETVVSLDEITTIPYVQVRARFPLSLRALQREGILESDREREERIAREQAELERRLAAEFDARMEEGRRDLQDSMDEAAEEMQDRISDAMSR